LLLSGAIFHKLRHRNRQKLPLQTSPHETKVTATRGVFNAAAGCTAAAHCRTMPEAPGPPRQGPRCRSPWLGRTPAGAARRSVGVNDQREWKRTKRRERARKRSPRDLVQKKQKNAKSATVARPCPWPLRRRALRLVWAYLSASEFQRLWSQVARVFPDKGSTP